MVTKPPAPTPKKAQIQTAKGRPPRKENTRGKVVEKTEAAPKSAPSNPKRPDVSRTHEYLDSVKPGEIRSESKRLIEQLKQASEAGDHVRQTQLKDALAGLKDKANAAGMGPKDLPELADTSTLLQILQAVMPGFGGKKPPARAPAAPTREARGSGGEYNKGTKRYPKHKCELMKYKDMRCDGEKHHVVPDFTLRVGKATEKFDPATRIPGTPAYDDGLAICLSKKEHQGLHKTTDEKIQRAANSKGVITAKEVKTIGVAEAAKKSGCNPRNMRRQLKKKMTLDDDVLLRGVKDARNVTDEMWRALKPDTEK